MPTSDDIRLRRHTDVSQDPHTTNGVSPPLTETLSAPRHPAAYRIGSSHIGRPRCCLKPDMAQHQTSSMQEGSHTLTLLTRPLLTENSAPSSSSRSASSWISVATLSSRRRPRNTPPSWRPSKDIGDGWSLLSLPSATRVPRSPARQSPMDFPMDGGALGGTL